MNLENYFCVFPRALPERLCNDLIDYGNEKSHEVALTGDENREKPSDLSKLYKTRNSSIVWMGDNWIYNAINPLVEQANKDMNWNFDLSFPETCQWTKYSETQHYTWHQDSFRSPFNEPRTPRHGMVRKLSVTVSLAEGDSYEGGDLQFDLRNHIEENNSNIVTSLDARQKGSVIVFPSFVWHRVTPVTKGTRYSLVIWTLGENFK